MFQPASIRTVSAVFFVLSIFSSALAASNSFVSVSGIDVGACDLPASPCRTFQYALGKTSPNGEIKALTPGNYSPVTINKSIRLTGVPGAGISANAGTAITINATGAGVVQLDGLTLDGVNKAASNGIVLNSGARLSVTNSIVRNFSQFGINIATNAGASLVSIEDVHVEQTTSTAVLVNPPVFGPTINALINRVTVVNCDTFGVDIGNNSTASITNSVISLTGMDGIHLAAPTARLFLSKSQSIRNFGYGVRVDAGSAESGGDNFLGGNASGAVFGTLTNVGNL